MAEKDLAQLIEDMSNSLNAELHQAVAELRTEWRESADRIENAVGRNSKMVTAGTLAVGALNRSVARHDQAIKDLQARMRTLERQRKRKKE
jgi:hypothetical protein